MKRMTRVTHALIVLLAISPACFASGYRGDMAQAWGDVSIVVLGRLEVVRDSHQEAERGRGLYAMEIEKVYKGVIPESRIEFLDPYFRSMASLHIRHATKYLVFLQTPDDRNKCPHPAREGLGTALSSLHVFKVDDKNLEEIEAGIAVIQAYESLRPDDRKAFLLQTLTVTNAYSHSFIVRKILKAGIKEAIPYFHQRLSGTKEETEKLVFISNLRCLGEPNVKAMLLSWLADDSFQRKGEIIEEMVRLKDPLLVPAIRKYVNAKDDLVAVTARSALFRLGASDGKRLLLDMIKTSKDPTARYNAIHPLNWNYSGEFTEEEKKTIGKLVHDRDQRIARVAGYILEKWKAKSNKTDTRDGL